MQKLLIIDDDAGFATFVEIVAEELGYDVRTAGDGFAAEEVRRLFSPDVILVDILLPGRDGIEVVRQLAEDGETARIVLVSGSIPLYMNAALEIARAAGVRDVVAARKPLAIADLRALLA